MLLMSMSSRSEDDGGPDKGVNGRAASPADAVFYQGLAPEIRQRRVCGGVGDADVDDAAHSGGQSGGVDQLAGIVERQSS